MNKKRAAELLTNGSLWPIWDAPYRPAGRYRRMLIEKRIRKAFDDMKLTPPKKQSAGQPGLEPPIQAGQ